jgi:ABC-type multidrug transport system ATPase subunit
MKLEISNISKQLGKISIFENFTYTFFPGEVYLILGSNGSGKTTLLKCISSLYLPDKGSLVFQNVTIASRKQFVFYRQQVSLFINSSKFLIPNLTIIQNIRFFLGINNLDYKNLKPQTLELLHEFDLTTYTNRKINLLSKGMKQKVSLIIAFLKNANILLLDEPYDGLDTHAIHVLKELIKFHSKDKIIILTSPNNIDTLATKIINLK